MWLVLSDLDGTLIDFNTYEPGPAAKLARELAEGGNILALVSSKTRAEMELWAKRLGVENAILIPESGSAVILPQGGPPLVSMDSKWAKVFSRRELVQPGVELLVRELGARPISQMKPEEIARLTGLPREQAELARRREFSETLLLDDYGRARGLVKRPLRLIPGRRFHHLVWGADKGVAARWLIRKLAPVKVLAVGDSLADAPMLRVAEVPVLVALEPGRWDERVRVPGLVRAPAPGPEGWAWAIRRFILG